MKNENNKTSLVVRQEYERHSKFNPKSMAEIFENVYPNRRPIVKGMIYAGAYLFSGAAKIGNSFFMLQLAYYVSAGQVLWGHEVKQCTVLYLALEDDENRIQKRLFDMFGSENVRDNLFFHTKASLLHNGLEKELEDFVKEHTDTGLIIIDTLQKVRGNENENTSYAKDYTDMSRFKAFADTYDVCVVLVHHNRKQSSDDPFDMISGTNGLMGAADCSIMLKKDNRTSDKAILQLTGRDQLDQKISIKRDDEKPIWQFENAETELYREPPEPVLELIANFVTADNSFWSGSSTELVEILQTDLQPNALSTMLNVRAGKLLDKYGINYEKGRNHSGRFIKLEFIGKDA